MQLQIKPDESSTAYLRRVQKHRQSLIHARLPNKATATQAAKSKIPQIRKKNGMLKYPDDIVVQARAMWVAGVKYRRIASTLYLTEKQVQLFVRRWDSRTYCIPTQAQVERYQSWQGNLPEGPMLAARRTAWLQAINDLTVRLKYQRNIE